MSAPFLIATLIASTVASGVSAYAQQQAANKAANINAQNLRKQADDTLSAAQEQSAQYRQKVRALVGSQEVGFAASGIEINSGSAKEITSETKMIGESDAKTITENAQKKAESLRAGASAYDAGQVSSLLAGGSALLSTGASSYGIYRR